MIKTVEYTYEMECLDCGRIVKARKAQWKLKSFKRECVCKYDADISGLYGWGEWERQSRINILQSVNNMQCIK